MSKESVARRGWIRRSTIFFYGIVSYLLGVSALLGIIAVSVGVVKFQKEPFSLSSPWLALIFNIFLMSLFGLQHSIMARPWFKEKWTRVIPNEAERSTYVLATAIVTWIMLALWQVNPSTLWQVDIPIFKMVTTALGVFGWAYLFLATFCINHFELFGLEQVWYSLVNKVPPKLPFKERLMYRFDRHPIMTGALIGLWATPTMTYDRFQFSILFTVYVIIGVSYEERDLIRKWGEKYLNYCRRVHTMVPRIKRILP